MSENTKLLVSVSLIIIVSGFSFLWFGFRFAPVPPTPSLSPSPIVENTPDATVSATIGVEGERALVTTVIDGDTIKIQNGQTVRLIGIDTPETVDPRRPVGCFGKEASNETKSLLTGKVVILQKDVSDKDKYGRLLRLVFLPLDSGQILFVDDYLVREGFARVYTYPPDVKFDAQFREAENEAKIKKRGLWASC